MGSGMKFVIRDTVRTQHVLRVGLSVSDQPVVTEIEIDIPKNEYASDLKPVLALGVKSYVDPQGYICFDHAFSVPTFASSDWGTVIRRVKRVLAVEGEHAVIWQLVLLLDGTHTFGSIISKLPAAEALCRLMIHTGIAEEHDGMLGRFLHSCTIKGVLPTGCLSRSELLELVASKPHNKETGATIVSLQVSVPDSLVEFRNLTHQRRSQLNFTGSAMGFEELSSALDTAFGITGTYELTGHRLDLRAYPSSGGLYAVGFYVAIFETCGIAPGIYRYDPRNAELIAHRKGQFKTDFLRACVPGQHRYVTDVSTIVFMVGDLLRHEKKYGPGGYRMIAAECGHAAQNLILAATCLGLQVRPCGGFFDHPLNELLEPVPGEVFMLAVLLGGTAHSQSISTRDTER